MKYVFLLLTILAFPILLSSQVKYESGYFINQDEEKILCWIKNEGWKNNPTSFQYKLSETGSEQTANIDSVIEFGFQSTLKYTKLILDMEKSSEQVGSLEYGSLPILVKDTVFLQVVLDGKATLLKYEDGFIKKYFFALENQPIKQLIYKKYLTPDKKIAENLTYKKQLKDNLACPQLTKRDRFKLKYKEASLLRYFIKYNSCQNANFLVYVNQVKKDLFNLYVRPGISLVSQSIQLQINPTKNIDFDKGLGGRIGLEFELIIPQSQDKFAFFCEPTLSRYSVKKVLGSTTSSTPNNQMVTLNYSSIQMPVGVRHYHFLNNHAQIFLDGSFTFERDFDSVIKFSHGADIEAVSNSSFNLGLGYRFRKKFVVQFRYSVSKNLIFKIGSGEAKYRAVIFMIGYDISGNKPIRKKSI